MPRVRKGSARKRAHKRVLREARGYYGTKSRHFQQAKVALMRAGKFAYRDRRNRKRDMRRLWITRITAACRMRGVRYSLFMNGLTKSGIMLGLGETSDEVVQTLRDMRRYDIDMLTLGQYLQPSRDHLPVEKYYTPDEFEELRDLALSLGFANVASAPMVRSSYHADQQADEVINPD